MNPHIPSRTAPPTIDPDDSWVVARSTADGARITLDDGTTVTWLRDESPLVANTEAGLRFSVSPPAGDTASFEPYLGMVGHAVVVRDDAKVFIHLHPLGTISVAAQARLTSPAKATQDPHAAHTSRAAQNGSTAKGSKSS